MSGEMQELPLSIHERWLLDNSLFRSPHLIFRYLFEFNRRVSPQLFRAAWRSVIRHFEPLRYRYEVDYTKRTMRKCLVAADAPDTQWDDGLSEMQLKTPVAFPEGMAVLLCKSYEMVHSLLNLTQQTPSLQLALIDRGPDRPQLLLRVENHLPSDVSLQSSFSGAHSNSLIAGPNQCDLLNGAQNCGRSTGNRAAANCNPWRLASQERGASIELIAQPNVFSEWVEAVGAYERRSDAVRKSRQSREPSSSRVVVDRSDPEFWRQLRETSRWFECSSALLPASSMASPAAKSGDRAYLRDARVQFCERDELEELFACAHTLGLKSLAPLVLAAALRALVAGDNAGGADSVAAGRRGLLNIISHGRALPQLPAPFDVSAESKLGIDIRNMAGAAALSLFFCWSHSFFAQSQVGLAQSLLSCSRSSARSPSSARASPACSPPSRTPASICARTAASPSGCRSSVRCCTCQMSRRAAPSTSWARGSPTKLASANPHLSRKRRLRSRRLRLLNC